MITRLVLFFLAAAFGAVGAFRLPRAKSWLAVAALTLSGPVAPALAEVDASSVRALEQVMRVQGSLKYVDETVNVEGNPRAVVQQINLLLSNYKLKDNVRLSLPLIADSGRREEARTHGVAAVEDLQLVSEYFDDDINETTGVKTPPAQVLKLALQATEAAGKELREFVSLLPQSVVADAKTKIDQEFSAP
jgi:hypothetical protein